MEPSAPPGHRLPVVVCRRRPGTWGICPAPRRRRWGPGARRVRHPSARSSPVRSSRRFSTATCLRSSPLTHIRGRSLHDAFVIVDEAQSLERGVLLTVLSRIGQNPRSSSPTTSPSGTTSGSAGHDGVAAVIETLKGHPLFAHVTLTRSERRRSRPWSPTFRGLDPAFGSPLRPVVRPPGRGDRPAFRLIRHTGPRRAMGGTWVWFPVDPGCDSGPTSRIGNNAREGRWRSMPAGIARLGDPSPRPPAVPAGPAWYRPAAAAASVPRRCSPAASRSRHWWPASRSSLVAQAGGAPADAAIAALGARPARPARCRWPMRSPRPGTAAYRPGRHRPGDRSGRPATGARRRREPDRRRRQRRPRASSREGGRSRQGKAIADARSNLRRPRGPAADSGGASRR